ncbi:MAG: glycosyltransferase family 4 protein [bacterium]
MAAIHQLLAGFTRGDAISNEAVVFRRIFRSWGFDSEIFCEARRTLPELRKDSFDLTEYKAKARGDDVVLLHLSIGSPANELFSGLSCRRAILYHNITPPAFFAKVNRQVARALESGIKQVKALAGTADVTMAVSQFNADELVQIGYKNVRVLPIILDMEQLHVKPDKKVLRKLDDGMVNVLFVGRCAPNKRLEDLLLAFWFYQKTVESNSRLILVGSTAGVERYYRVLRVLERDLGLRNVCYAGAVKQSSVNAYYSSADVFLCMSEHEGFCIPLIESMVNDVPVMAYSAGAVPETLDGAGVLFSEKRFNMIAEMMGKVVCDGSLRSAIIDGQRSRLTRYTSRNMESELKECLKPLLNS